MFKNETEPDYMTGKLKVRLSPGIVAIVDCTTEVHDLLFKYSWTVHGKPGHYYMVRLEHQKGLGKWVRKYFTRDLIGREAVGFDVHHKDGDSLNCSRCVKLF